MLAMPHRNRPVDTNPLTHVSKEKVTPLHPDASLKPLPAAARVSPTILSQLPFGPSSSSDASSSRPYAANKQQQQLLTGGRATSVGMNFSLAKTGSSDPDFDAEEDRLRRNSLTEEEKEQIDDMNRQSASGFRSRRHVEALTDAALLKLLSTNSQGSQMQGKRPGRLSSAGSDAGGAVADSTRGTGILTPAPINQSRSDNSAKPTATAASASIASSMGYSHKATLPIHSCASNSAESSETTIYSSASACALQQKIQQLEALLNAERLQRNEAERELTQAAKVLQTAGSGTSSSAAPSGVGKPPLAPSTNTNSKKADAPAKLKVKHSYDPMSQSLGVLRKESRRQTNLHGKSAAIVRRMEVERKRLGLNSAGNSSQCSSAASIVEPPQQKRVVFQSTPLRDRAITPSSMASSMTQPQV